MDRVRIAFIGAGNLAMSMHYPSLASMPDVTISGIAELDETRLNAAADKYHVEARFRDYLKMLDQVEADAVYCIMPPMDLWYVVTACLERRKHVFIEKPPGMTTFQTASWARLAERNRCLTMCAFNRRFIPCLKQAKERVEQHGPVIQCTATFVKHYTDERGYYKGAIDILRCDAIHAVDSLRWLGGEVDRLASDIGQYSSPYANAFNALIKFRSGAVGFLVANWAVGGRLHTWEIHSRGISAYVDPDTVGAQILVRDRPERERIDPVAAAGNADRHVTYGFLGENRHFVDCIKSGRLPETHFGDAVKTMELVDRIYAGQI